MEGSLPPRYCSIKGCKTLIPGESFFKMCETCRDRYRNYGTTKRKKWKREKEEAVAEMERIREEENRQRIENGLPVRGTMHTITRPTSLTLLYCLSLSTTRFSSTGRTTRMAMP